MANNSDLAQIKKTHATVTYQLRKELSELNERSQKTEHDYYFSQKSLLESYLSSVLDAFELLLQEGAEYLISSNQIGHSSLGEQSIFKQLGSAGVDLSILKTWYQCLVIKKGHMQKLSLLKSLQLEKQALLDSVSSGWIFKDPAPGKEREFQDYKEGISEVKQHIIQATQAINETSAKLEGIYDPLLKSMLQNVNEIALLQCGSKVAVILRDFKCEFNVRSESHAQSQRNIGGLMAEKATSLARMYEVVA